jgi:hypothetical protein
LKRTNTPPRTRPTPSVDVDQLRSLFEADLYELLRQPTVMRSLKHLLCSSDVKTSQKAWELVLKHGMPVSKDGEDQGNRSFQLIVNVPRSTLPAGKQPMTHVLPRDGE